MKVAAVHPGVFLHGTTLRHVAAPVQAVFLGVYWTIEDVATVPDATVRVFEEGFL